MLKNYLLLAVRNFRKDRHYSCINLLGLGVSLATVMLIVAYIRYELSFDRNFPNHDRVFQVLMETRAAGHVQKSMSIPTPLGPALRDEFPEVEATTTFSQGSMVFRHNNQLINIHSTTASPSFFSVFNFPFIYGNAASALTRSDNIVLTEATAQKLFRDQYPVGKTMSAFQYDGTEKQYTVSAVISNIPLNSHFNLEAIIPVRETKETLDFNAYSSAPQYILLKRKTIAGSFDQKMTAFYKKDNAPETVKIQLLPVTDIRLHSGKIDNQVNNVSDIRFIYIFGAIALLILIIASINYINLTTARSMQRFKEVGMRKVMGARAAQLVLQFTGESFVLFCLAIPIAVLLAYIAWPAFCSFLQIGNDIAYLINFSNLAYLAGISIITGVLAGLYPSFFLSFRPPVALFKGINNNIRVNFSLRKTLIVGQFSISALLIIATVIVQEQLHMLNNRPLGFNKEHLLILPHTGYKNGPAAAAFKQELLQQSGIRAVSISSLNIGKHFGSTSSMEDSSDSTRELNLAFIDADLDFIKTMDMPLLQGRNFSSAFPSDMIDISSILDAMGKAATQQEKDEFYKKILQRPIIISESVAKALHLQNPVGATLKTGALQGTVIGVTKDIQALTLKNVSPMAVFRYNHNASGQVYVRVQPDHVPETIQMIQSKWKKYLPNQIFDVEFTDARLQKLYEAENRLASLFTAFAILAIGISALGLFSLVALLLKQKTKEIGIRKIMGATLLDISALFSKDFISMITLAIIIASPVAWWSMNKWLQDYAARIEISWWVFAVTGVATLLIALITVNIQVARAARANPVKSLRSE